MIGLLYYYSEVALVNPKIFKSEKYYFCAWDG